MAAMVPMARPIWTEEMRKEAIETLDSGIWVKGPKNRLFSDNFAQYCKASAAIPCSSGSTALYVALRLLGIGPGDEVILPSFTFIATATSVSLTGAKPVFADVESEYWCLCPHDTRLRINEKTKAILGVHLFGQTYHPKLIELAQEFDLPIIEDAAQAHGTELMVNGTPMKAGTLGDIGCFSFFPTKNMAVGGEGGMITTNNVELGKRLHTIVNHGRDGSLISQELGTNLRMSEAMAAIGNIQLKHLDEWLMRRTEIAEKYLLALNQHPEIIAPKVRDDSKHSWHQFCILAQNPLKILEDFENQGISARRIYQQPCHLHTVYTQHEQYQEVFPVTGALSQSMISIPVHHGLYDNEVEKVVIALSNL